MSLGGSLACHLGLRQKSDPRLRGLILLSPAFNISLKKALGLRLLKPVRNLKNKGTRAADYFLDHRLYSYLHTPLNRAAEVLKLGREAAARIEELKSKPVLMFAGDLESTVSFEAMETVARKAPWIEFIRLPRSRHILTVEPDRQSMFDATAQFVEKCVRKY